MKKKHLIYELSKADYITLLAVGMIVCAFWLLWLNKTYLAVSVAFVSMFLDYLDGAFARRFGSSPYGKVLDSLYDVFGWVLFPALVINIQSNWTWYIVVITTLYCVFAVLRLSRFTIGGYVQKAEKYYVGVPVLFSKYALLVAFIFKAHIAALILAIMIPLMVSSRLVKKPHAFWAQIELLYAAIFLWLYLQHV